MTGVLLSGLVIGIGATVIFDLWNLLLNRVLGIPLPNWALVGRWFCHLFSGRFIHRDITSTPPVVQELAWGWAFHYAVGTSFGVATALIGGAAWLRGPSLALPMAVGLGTVLLGWLILAPGMGAGIAARLKPNPTRIRMLNIIAHFVFGLAMYGIARLIA